MEILLYKIPQDADLKTGLQVCYKDTFGAFTKLGIITDTFPQDGFTMYLLNTAMGAYMADELRLINHLEQDKVTALSNEFSRIVSSWCSAEQLAEINRLNALPQNVGCCASHDYYDTNMAMDEAFTKTFGREFTFFNDDEPETEVGNSIDTDYFNAAWELSKQNKFAQPPVIGCPFDEPFTYNPSTLIN
jgi:hypothetical protein